MALSTLTARVDKQDKKDFDDFCSTVGLTSSAAINMYVKAVVHERKIPFEIKQPDPFYSTTNQKHLQSSIKQLQEGRGTAHDMIEDGNE